MIKFNHSYLHPINYRVSTICYTQTLICLGQIWRGYVFTVLGWHKINVHKIEDATIYIYICWWTQSEQVGSSGIIKFMTSWWIGQCLTYWVTTAPMYSIANGKNCQLFFRVLLTQIPPKIMDYRNGKWRNLNKGIVSKSLNYPSFLLYVMVYKSTTDLHKMINQARVQVPFLSLHWLQHSNIINKTWLTLPGGQALALNGFLKKQNKTKNI